MIHTVPVGAEPEGVKMSPDGRFVYVTSEDTGTVSVIDPAAAKAIKSFKVGRRPRSVASFGSAERIFPRRTTAR